MSRGRRIAIVAASFALVAGLAWFLLDRKPSIETVGEFSDDELAQYFVSIFLKSNGWTALPDP